MGNRVMQHFNRQPTSQRAFSLLLSVAVMWQAAAIPAAAADGAALSLPSLLEEVRRVNPELRAARKRWEAAQARVPLSKGLPAPRIGIEFEEIPKGTVRLDQATLMYQLIQSLPFPGKISARRQVAIAEAQRAAAELKKVEWEVLSHLKSTYYDLFLVNRELEIQEEQVLWLRQAAGTAQAGYATGAETHTALLQAQAELLQGANGLRTLTQRRQATVSHLNHLFSRESHHEAGGPGAIPLMFVPYSPEELVLIAQETQPELLVFKFMAERAAAEWRLAKRELLPDLETMVELRDPAMGPLGPWDLTLALVLPFWFWTKARYGVKIALSDKESAEAAYQAMHNEITTRIHEHWHQAFAAYNTAKLSRDGLIPLSQQAVASAFAAYQSGRGSFSDLLEALRRLSESQRTYAERLVDLEQHVVMLEEAAGVPLRAAHAVPTSPAPTPQTGGPR